MAFAAGWAACFTICAALGAFLWSILGKAKDDTIASLTKAMETNEARCAETIGGLSTRVQQLETLLLLHGPGDLKQELSKALAEIRVAMGSGNETGR